MVRNGLLHGVLPPSMVSPGTAFGLAIRNQEFCSSLAVAAISGVVALATYVYANEHEVRQFYTRHSKALLSLYILCMSIIWLSLVFNARFVCTRFISIWLYGK